jgi:hypothetical protein
VAKDKEVMVNQISDVLYEKIKKVRGSAKNVEEDTDETRSATELHEENQMEPISLNVN